MSLTYSQAHDAFDRMDNLGRAGVKIRLAKEMEKHGLDPRDPRASHAYHLAWIQAVKDELAGVKLP